MSCFSCHPSPTLLFSCLQKLFIGSVSVMNIIPSFHNIYLENKSSLILSELTKQTYRINHKHLYII